MASLDILCFNPFNLKNKTMKMEHEKIFCSTSKMLKNVSWPPNYPPPSSSPSYILNVRSLSTQISHYDHIKGSSKPPESFKNCVVTFEMLVLASKVCFSEPNSIKDVMVTSFAFLNSTLISKILLRKLDQTRAKFSQRKRQ